MIAARNKDWHHRWMLLSVALVPALLLFAANLADLAASRILFLLWTIIAVNLSTKTLHNLDELASMLQIFTSSI